jgi:hypothetical protein
LPALLHLLRDAKENSAFCRYAGNRRANVSGFKDADGARSKEECKMTAEIVIRETAEGVEILEGERRLTSLLAIHDEVVITTPELGDVVVARLPDGRLRASCDPELIKLFRRTT